MGRMFPMIQRGIAVRMGTFKRAGDAAKRPPRSSRMGIMEIIKIIPSLEIIPDKLDVNHCTRASAIS
jgi:hypothetical protein